MRLWPFIFLALLAALLPHGTRHVRHFHRPHPASVRDAADNLTITQSSTNWIQSYAYDAGWRLTNTVSPAGGFLYQFQSPIVYRPSAILLPNGAYITNSYDSLARLKSTALANHWGHVLDGYTYTVDPLGLRTNIVRNFGLTTNLVNVGYDKIDQITSWSASESGD